MTCHKCNDTEWVKYDKNHMTKCNACCKCSEGWWQLVGYHSHPDMWCCKEGCGKVVKPHYVPTSRIAYCEILND